MDFPGQERFGCPKHPGFLRYWPIYYKGFLRNSRSPGKTIVLGECFLKHIECAGVNVMSPGQCLRNSARNGKVLGSNKEALGKVYGLLGLAEVCPGI